MLVRFFSGVAIGSVSVIVPMYISEICPDKLRGTFGVLHQLNIVFGIAIADALGLFQTQTVDFRENEILRKEVKLVDFK